MIEDLKLWLDDLHPILQGIIGSAIFGLLVFFGRLLVKYLSNWNQKYKRRNSIREIQKIVLHQRYVNSNGMYYFTQGYLLVIYKALGNLIRGLLIYFAAHLVSIFFNLEVLDYIGLYFCIQHLISGWSWLDSSWGEKDLRDYDQTLVQEIQKSFESHDVFAGSAKKNSSQEETTNAKTTTSRKKKAAKKA